MDKECENCRFWKAMIKDDSQMIGWCRRHAPNPRAWSELSEDIDGTVELQVWWPKTYDTDWCGEHEDRIQIPLDGRAG